MTDGRLTQPFMQRGYGGTLGPRMHTKNYRNVDDSIEPVTLISPTQQALKQAQSEMKYQRSQLARKRKNTSPHKGGQPKKPKVQKKKHETIRKKENKKIPQKRFIVLPKRKRSKPTPRDIFA